MVIESNLFKSCEGKMNIWIIDHYSSEPKYGGISRQFDFARELSRRGYRVLVISSSFSHFTHTYISQEKVSFSKIDENVGYAYVKTTQYKKNSSIKRIINMFSFIISVWKNYKKLLSYYGSPQIVVGCSIHPLTWIVANYISVKCHAKFIVEVRDLWQENQIDDEGM